MTEKKNKKDKKGTEKGSEPEEVVEKVEKPTAGEELAEVEESPNEKVIEKKIKKGEKDILAEERTYIEWNPRTKLGKQVKEGQLTTMADILRQSVPIKEVEIVDKLVPDLEEEIISVDRVQRTTDSGRRMRFRVVSAIGNRNGLVGVGVAKGKEAGPTIRKAIDRAKLNIKEIKRGCGSWECGCGGPHTVPFMVSGKSGSVEVTLRPAPQGVGLVSGEAANNIIGLSGITDVWIKTKGHTRTGINFAKAVFYALVSTNCVKIKEQDIKELNLVSGLVAKKVEEVQQDELEVTDEKK